jgi:chemosensory pili system protein ChpA (sensor histidine kinase/response regulator)
MTNNARFDLNALAAVKPALDGSLAEISGRLERYLGAPASSAAELTAARDELHRLLGVLKMVRLDGLVVFCTELDTVLGEIAGIQQISGMHRDALHRALFGITHFLDALASGADNAALRLFPQYQALQQLRGMEMAFELDLFYPNLAVLLPPEVLHAPPQGEAPARLKALRRQYQQGLLRWLRQDDIQAALQSMQQAVDGVLRRVPQDEGRAFWWIAGGLIDCLKLDGLPPELSARRLLGRIDQQIRSVTEGNAPDAQPVLNEMLYLIGRSHTVSNLVEAIKRVYALDSYMPELSALPPSEAAQLLNDMRDQLQVAEENWELCAQGDKAACEKFLERAAHLASQSEKLDHNTLQYLTKQIQALSQYASVPEHARLISVDMAMALLLLGGGIEHYSNLGSGFQEQARILSERMQAAVKQQPEDAQRLNDLVQLHYQMERGDVMAPLANEMLANLQHVEQGLNAFFSDAAKRDELGMLGHLLNQIQGGLHILSLEQAEQLLVSIQGVIRGFEQGDATPKPLESRALAGAVSALENYLQYLTHGQAGDVASLQAAADEMAKLHQAPAQMEAVAAPEQARPVEVQRPIGEDQELLEVFLEEAQEVLHIMRDNLEIGQLHPDSREPLVTIRRGFHTLKGSGRMVGLTDLGEVAWHVERAMNKWLQDNKPATPGLLHFIDQAAQSFAVWVSALSKHGGVRIEADELIAAAQRIEEGSEPEVPAPAPAVTAAPAALPEPTPEPAEEVVAVGEVTLSAALFEIASAEAMQNVATMHKLLAELRAAVPPLVQYDFMRAAHTLAGVNRTMSFVAVAELAYALEGWLQTRLDKAITVGEPQLALLDRVVAALDTMAQNVCDKQMPQQQADLIAQLAADKEKLGVEIAVPQAAPEPAQIAAAPPAQPEMPARAERPRLRDDVDEQLLPVFLEEADDLCPKIGAGLRAWREQPHDEQHVQELKRLLHTLKGSARMAGAMRIGELAHGMEEQVLSAATKSGQAGYWEKLEGDFDAISGMLEKLRAGELKEEPAPERRRRVSDQAGERRAERRTLDVGAERALYGNLLRVRSDVVDRLVNEAGEISVARSRMETEMRAFKEGLLELTGSVARLRKQLREVEIQAESQMQARVSLARDHSEQFDPLEFDRFTQLQELTRFMNESVHDVQTVQLSLLKNIDETAAAMSAQARLNRELQQKLMGVRMVPFASISDRLYRIVRQTAKELNKRVNLELLGSGVELDRSVLEKMTAPFEHLLRNAVVHGMEDEQTRSLAGKPAIGEIHLHLRQESNEVVFEFSDDGAGLNFAVLREKAEARGLLQPGEEASEDQLAQLIFISGLSTAREVTEVAGRGVGMDVVRSEIAALGGRIDVSSKPGSGTHFTIHLPLTLAVAQALMVRSGDATYAIPSTMVEQVRQVKSAELAQLYSDRQIEWQGKAYPFNYMPHLLGDAERVPENLPRNSVLLLRSGEQRMALHVDGLHGNHEVVVKNIGPQLARLPGIAGATVLGNGAVVLILNPAQLSQRIGAATRKARKAEPEVLQTQPLVMVVDDSLTVRKITTRLLTRAGYQVVTAKDGVDALEQLGEITPSVMLLDIEMPRMDGFELTKLLRRDAKTRNLPIIMITSRTAEKHRSHAMELGVNAYLGKPYQEEELLKKIAEFISVPEMG